MANDIPQAFSFKVEFWIDGVHKKDSTFQEVSGLSVETNDEEEGEENRFVHKLPGRVKHSNIKLKKGLINDPKIMKWIENALCPAAPIKSVNLIIRLVDRNDKTQASWKVYNTWPVKFEYEPLSANSNELAIETLELAYNRFERE